MARRTIDLNADLGEGCPWDDALLARVSSASISCGAHAGDDATIRRTLRAAGVRGVAVGAHPGYPDRAHFGRRELDLTMSEVRDLVLTQVEHLGLLAAGVGVRPRFVKPHGALYNQAQRERSVALAVASALKPIALPVVGMPGGALEREAAALGIPFVAEGFPDRRYGPDGFLVPRSRPDAILTDPAEIEAQLLSLMDRGIITLCLHGDNPHSIELADLAQDILDRHGFEARSFIEEYESHRKAREKRGEGRVY